MCTRQALLHWRHIKVSQGDLKMSMLVWCMLILLLCPNSKGMVVIKTRPERWRSYRMEKAQNIIQTLKRHAEGTFTSDFTHYLDKIKAKDFVEWLASKKEGCVEDLHHIAPQV